MATANLWDSRRSNSEPKRRNDPRAPEDHDLARVIHSGSFRRLQSKTQVLGLGESDFYRTRLTHSVEVAQIATGIKRFQENSDLDDEQRNVLPSLPTLTAISLAHDIGHPPFGHGGEVALNYMMRGENGFEGNAQSLRILCRLEKKTENFGLDLTRRTLLGVLKYPVSYGKVVSKFQSDKKEIGRQQSIRSVNAKDWKPPKCYYEEDQEIVDWILEPLQEQERKRFQRFDQSEDSKKSGDPHHKSLDASMMDISDDISYAVHDLEDAIHMKFIQNTCSDRERLGSIVSKLDRQWLDKWELSHLVEELFGEKWQRKDAISKLVNCMICSTHITVNEGFSTPLLKYRLTLEEQARSLVMELKELVISKVIKTPEVQTLEYSGQLLVMELYEAMISAPDRLLPQDTQRIHQLGDRPLSRLVSDHISGMTDDYAARIHGRLFSPNTGSIFEKM